MPKRICRTALLLAALITGRAAAADLALVTEDYPPFNMLAADGSVTGLSTDLLRAALGRAGITYDIRLMPWQRAMRLAANERNTCVYSMSRLPEREGTYIWVGPLVHNDWTLFAAPGSRIVLSTLDDARSYRIGTYIGDAIESDLTSRGFKVDGADNDRLNPKKLVADRIDLWATGGLLGPYLARLEGIVGLKPVLVFRTTQMYLACNRRIAPSVASAIDRELAAIEADRSAEQIRARYLAGPSTQ